MNQERERTFCILRENTTYYDSTNAYKYFVEVLEEEEEEFTRDKILDGNEFSTPFQDIWLNPEQTHQVCFVHDPLFNVNYVRIRRQSDLEQKSISGLSEWFYCYWDGEL